ncbi:hypothetical protein L593_01565 [Salinarchaeum sp. Harcht-Bsk1]|uniref:LURP-one-related/scramblase family protein n=1 Tax=Salinarchaeum sp. Harcht-Bsk1 TaxID=1333523 RepID=UPI000342483B|nr:LURP-one-related family protein [Salinarchaeum sp. Harcht-Bsk1]AGN00266.1 hypothetical protein L593_01565 [Salinarchaeum sp. Harcht-Bsk1]
MSAVTDDIDEISGVDLDDDEYEIVQSLVRNKYEAYDSNGDLVFKGKQKMFKMKEEFPFVDANGDELFTVTAGGILDVAGDYTLTDAETGEPIVVLDNNWSFLNDVWKIRHPQNEALVATIELQSVVSELVRRFVPYGTFLPHKYEITDVDDDHVGDIEGQLSLKDTYEVSIDDATDVPRDAVVAAACVIDAIEGN